MNNNQPISAKLVNTLMSSHSFAALKNEDDNHNNALRFVKDILPLESNEDKIYSYVAAALKGKSSKNTLNEIPSMIKWWRDQGVEFKNDEDDKPNTIPAVLVRMVEAIDGMELFHDSINQSYISVPNETGGKNTYLLSSKQAMRYLKKLYYDAAEKPITTQNYSEALAILESKAYYEGDEHPVFLRLARHKDCIYINIGDKNGTAVKIDKNSYAVVQQTPVPFLKSDTMGALPLPEKHADDYCALHELQKLLNIEDSIFYRVVAFMIGSLKPEGPYICFITEGEQGSGKSFLNSLLKNTIDPSPASKLRLPKEERELMIIAKLFYMLVFDNISGIKNDISDALCSLSTGSGFTARQLFTDDELKIFNECRPYILNGISGITHRPDLLDRSLSVRLPSMPADKRKTESELLAEFDILLPRLLDKLFLIVSCALRRFDEVEVPKNIRMVDAAKWLSAAEPETGFPEGSLLKALTASQDEIIKETMERNSLAVALFQMLETRGVFNGTVGELLLEIEQDKPRYDKYFPTTPSYLSKELDRLKPALKIAGVIVKFGPKRNHGKTISLWLSEDGLLEEAISKRGLAGMDTFPT